MNNIYEDLKKYLEETPIEDVERIWKETEKYDNAGPTVNEYISAVKNHKRQLYLFELKKRFIQLYFKYRFKIKYFFYLRKIKKADSINKILF